MSSTILSGITGWQNYRNSRTGYMHQLATITGEVYNYLGRVNAEPNRASFWWACAGGAIALRNEWVSPQINPNLFSIARNLASSGQINFYAIIP
jgi:hypothetical protein